MRLNPYLFFNGQCEAAFKFYEQALGAKGVMLMRYSEGPMAEQSPPDWRDKVMHARITVRDMVLMGSDPPPGRYEQPQGFFVTLNIDDPAEADRVFHALAEGGTVRMDIQKTFWAQRFGMLVDRFGIPWMVNCEAAH
jgi:PhnB protein